MLKNFYDNNLKYLQVDFKKRLDVIYGIRSKVVHTGSPVIGAMLGNSIFGLYAEKDDIFFSSDEDLEDFFYRAITRKAGLEPEPITKNLEKYLFDHHLAQHQGIVTDIVFNKLKRTDSIKY